MAEPLSYKGWLIFTRGNDKYDYCSEALYNFCRDNSVGTIIGYRGKSPHANEYGFAWGIEDAKRQIDRRLIINANE